MSQVEPAPGTAPAVSPRVAEFQQALRAATPRVIVTWVLVAVNVAVFLAMLVKGAGFMDPDIQVLLAWGADYGPRTTGGQWWRLFTAMFVHIGALHLVMNMVGVLQVGHIVERLLGNVGFLVLYVISGLCGSCASLLWGPHNVSAGASGALFGVYGALLGFMLNKKSAIPQEVLQRVMRSAVIVIGYNLFYGLTKKQIDNAAHIGGLASGFLGGLALSHPLTAEAVGRRWRRNAIFGAVGSIVVVGLAAAAPRLPFDFWAVMARLGEVEQRSIDGYNEAIRKAKANQMTEAELADTVETKVLPDWHRSRVELEGAPKGLPSYQTEALTKLLPYMTAREEGWELLVKAVRTQDPEVTKKAREKLAEADRLVKLVGQ